MLPQRILSAPEIGQTVGFILEFTAFFQDFLGRIPENLQPEVLRSIRSMCDDTLRLALQAGANGGSGSGSDNVNGGNANGASGESMNGESVNGGSGEGQGMC